MVRVAVLGAGFMGGTHAKAYAALPNVEVAAIYAPSADRAGPLAQEIGSRYTDDLDAILTDPGIEAVDICLPTHLHMDYARLAMKAGKHGLIEKPLARTYEDAAKLAALAKRAKGVTMCAMCMRFWPGWSWLKKAIDEGFRAFTRAYGDAFETFFAPLQYFLISVERFMTESPSDHPPADLGNRLGGEPKRQGRRGMPRHVPADRIPAVRHLRCPESARRFW